MLSLLPNIHACYTYIHEWIDNVCKVAVIIWYHPSHNNWRCGGGLYNIRDRELRVNDNEKKILHTTDTNTNMRGRIQQNKNKK